MSFVPRQISPATYLTFEMVMMLFMAHPFQKKLTSASIKIYDADVHYAQVCRGMGDPGIPLMLYRIHDKRDKAVITTEHAVSSQDHPKLTEKREGSMAENGEKLGSEITVGSIQPVFFEFLCSGEVVMPAETVLKGQYHLCFEDITVNDRYNLSYLQVTLKA